jgi:5-methylcytosine-specific restriction protein A
VARERTKARELRQSSWWKSCIARGICHYCGKTFKSSELTMDHVIPVARGGKSVRSNVVPSCAKCNKSKRHFTPAEMILAEMEKAEKEKSQPAVEVNGNESC